MAQFHSVLFDLDGTLINTVELVVASFQYAFAAELGRAVKAEEVLARFGEPLRDTFARLAGPEHADRLIATYRQFNVANHDRLVTPFPGVREAVENLHQAGIKLAVTTSKVYDTALMGLRLYGLDQWMDAIVAADDVKRHKPDPEAVFVSLERLGQPADGGALIVGDSPFDLTAGRRAGIRTCAVGWSIFPADELNACEPDFWAAAPGDLVRICLNGEGT